MGIFDALNTCRAVCMAQVLRPQNISGNIANAQPTLQGLRHQFRRTSFRIQRTRPSSRCILHKLRTRHHFPLRNGASGIERRHFMAITRRILLGWQRPPGSPTVPVFTGSPTIPPRRFSGQCLRNLVNGRLLPMELRSIPRPNRSAICRRSPVSDNSVRGRRTPLFLRPLTCHTPTTGLGKQLLAAPGRTLFGGGGLEPLRFSHKPLRLCTPRYRSRCNFDRSRRLDEAATAGSDHSGNDAVVGVSSDSLTTNIAVGDTIVVDGHNTHIRQTATAGNSIDITERSVPCSLRAGDTGRCSHLNTYPASLRLHTVRGQSLDHHTSPHWARSALHPPRRRAAPAAALPHCFLMQRLWGVWEEETITAGVTAFTRLSPGPICIAMGQDGRASPAVPSDI